ncbi:hypothetical protein TUMEXPCC7403_13840 [Tumidithrix helvetica PCC 7403]|uniref:FeoA family protein n=1 Tax=Tumidithrix helvetica TaxID=3457545 RepID=UPI003CAE12C3
MSMQGFTVSSSSLSLLQVGESGVVTSLNKVNDRTLHQLERAGVVLGAKVTIAKRFPKVAIQVGTNYLTLSDAIARSIQIRLLNVHNTRMAG